MYLQFTSGVYGVVDEIYYNSVTKYELDMKSGLEFKLSTLKIMNK